MPVTRNLPIEIGRLFRARQSRLVDAGSTMRLGHLGAVCFTWANPGDAEEFASQASASSGASCHIGESAKLRDWLDDIPGAG